MHVCERVCTLKWSLLLVCISAWKASCLISAPNKDGASILVSVAFSSTESEEEEEEKHVVRVELMKVAKAFYMKGTKQSPPSCFAC